MLDIKRKGLRVKTRNPFKINGGAEGNRTHDLLNAIQALSQLSYSPTTNLKDKASPALVKSFGGCSPY
jgi:hypothetical protein